MPGKPWQLQGHLWRLLQAAVVQQATAAAAVVQQATAAAAVVQQATAAVVQHATATAVVQHAMLAQPASLLAPRTTHPKASQASLDCLNCCPCPPVPGESPRHPS